MKPAFLLASRNAIWGVGWRPSASLHRSRKPRRSRRGTSPLCVPTFEPSALSETLRPPLVTFLDRVTPGHKDDRQCRGCGLGRERRRGIGDDHGYLPAKKVRHQKRQPLIPARVDFDRDWPSTKPASFKPWRNAVTRSCGTSVSVSLRRNPTTGIAGCCARARLTLAVS